MERNFGKMTPTLVKLSAVRKTKISLCVLSGQFLLNETTMSLSNVLRFR